MAYAMLSTQELLKINTMSHLIVKNLTTHFYTREGLTTAVDNVSFTLEAGQILGIVGESGSGKSVACYSLLGLIPSPPGKVVNGSALFNGEDLLTKTEAELRSVRGRKISMIFQDPMTSLNPHMRIGDQLIEAYRLHHKSTKKQATEKAIQLLQEVGIKDADTRIRAYPHEFSGGMRQRAMIAMALITEPELLIADEPTTALDVTVQAQILQLIKSIQQKRHLSVIFISHDLAVVSQIADQLIVMKEGKVVESGATASVFSEQKHPYTKKLIAAIPNKAKQVKYTATETNPLLTVNNLSTSFAQETTSWFGKKAARKVVVKDISFSIQQGEILGLVGESGSGKSTLGRSVIKLINADNGEINIDQHCIHTLQGDKLKQARKDFQMIFQDPYASLNPRLTVFDALAEPLLLHGIANKTNVVEKVNTLMDDVGLARKFVRKYPHEFSGGQRQRIAIARALAPQPKLIIADEPVSALDVTIQAQILELLLNLTQKHCLAMLFISHDLAVVRYLCDRVMVMHNGNLVEQGPTEDIYNQPTHPYTQKLISAIPTFMTQNMH